jgi:hypothetical protein
MALLVLVHYRNTQAVKMQPGTHLPPSMLPWHDGLILKSQPDKSDLLVTIERASDDICTSR